MKKVQRGFTMIELVMVIGITGVLAAVAVPLFVDVRTDARGAALKGTADALTSTAASNYAAASMDISKGFTVAVCGDVAKGLQNGLDSKVYAITAKNVTLNLATVCDLTTVTTPPLTATFTATGVVGKVASGI